MTSPSKRPRPVWMSLEEFDAMQDVCAAALAWSQIPTGEDDNQIFELGCAVTALEDIRATREVPA